MPQGAYVTAGYWDVLVASAFDRDRYRPTERTTLRSAALELSGRGLTDRDIAAALSLSESAVRALLES